MEIIDKKLQRTRKIINFTISFILAVFLILLCNTIIADLDSTVAYPNRKDFVDKKVEDKFSAEEKKINDEIDVLNVSRRNVQKMINTAIENKEAEQQSFDNWIKTRNTLGSAKQDPEVLKRINKLDEYQAVVQSWTTQSDSIYTIISGLEQQLYSSSDKKYEVDREVDKVYTTAINAYDIKVFLIRLLFIAPILALGIYLFIRKRKHKLGPLFMGFSLFSVYAFFIGLVPYLPSYGGYIRYTVGVLLTIGLGYYAIKRLREYSEKKKAELKSSSDDRASRLQTDTSEKAFNNHVCPSCGKDFIIKNWERIDGLDLQSAKPVASTYCRYCGMQLIKKCTACSQPNYAHLPYCIKCGESIK